MICVRAVIFFYCSRFCPSFFKYTGKIIKYVDLVIENLGSKVPQNNSTTFEVSKNDTLNDGTARGILSVWPEKIFPSLQGSWTFGKHRERRARSGSGADRRHP